VPDRRKHRGAHPEDVRLFSPDFHCRLSLAVDDLCWLLTRGYAADSSLKIVGDRYGLVARQRVAVARCSCGAAAAQRRRAHEVRAEALRNQPLGLDGYNVLTTIEAALSGGAIFTARDGTYRDMASMHGTYRKVAETLPALELLGSELTRLNVAECVLYLDRPVSNSGRLKSLIEDLAARNDWPWRVELAMNPDAVLTQALEIVATADSVILDRCRAWYNLARAIIARGVPQAWIVELSSATPATEFPL
jgi:hypothetical protein